MRRISEAGGLSLVKGFESFVPYVYDDKVPAQRIGGRYFYREWRPGDPIRGTLTIGYGHTDAAKHDLGFDLRNVPPGFRLTEAQASAILDVDLDECEMFVNDLVKVPISQGMFDALVSFTFNCGVGALQRILERLNRGMYEEARAALDLYVFSKGERMAGLQRRRDAEQALWDEQELPAWNTTVVVDHPAEVDIDTRKLAPAHMGQSSEGNTAVGIGVGGVGTTATMLSKAVSGASAAKSFTAGGFMVALASQPEFWAALGAAVLFVAAPAYVWLRRARDLNEGVR